MSHKFSSLSYGFILLTTISLTCFTPFAASEAPLGRIELSFDREHGNLITDFCLLGSIDKGKLQYHSQRSPSNTLMDTTRTIDFIFEELSKDNFEAFKLRQYAKDILTKFSIPESELTASKNIILRNFKQTDGVSCEKIQFRFHDPLKEFYNCHVVDEIEECESRFNNEARVFSIEYLISIEGTINDAEALFSAITNKLKLISALQSDSLIDANLAEKDRNNGFKRNWYFLYNKNVGFLFTQGGNYINMFFYYGDVNDYRSKMK